MEVAFEEYLTEVVDAEEVEEDPRKVKETPYTNEYAVAGWFKWHDNELP